MSSTTVLSLPHGYHTVTGDLTSNIDPTLGLFITFPMHLTELFKLHCVAIIILKMSWDPPCGYKVEILQASLPS